MTTTTKAKNSTTIITPKFRVSFPQVFQPKAPAVGAEPKYSITMIFSKSTDLTPLRQLVAQVLTEKFGPDNTKWPKGMRLPFRDGSEKDYDGYGPDTVFCSASSKVRPGLVDHNVQPIIEPSEFYPGCYAQAQISAYWYDKAGNKGVSFGLRNIQKVGDGEPLAGGEKAEDVFDAIEAPKSAAGAVSKTDPLAGLV